MLEIITVITSFCALIVSVATTVAVYAHKSGKTENRIEQTEKDVKEIKQEKAENSNRFLAIECDILEIQTFLKTTIESAKDILQKHSPYTLNPLGEKIYKDMDGASFIAKNKEVLFAKIDKKNPKTAYDVEKTAYFVCVSSSDEDYFIPIKNFVYNYPSQTKPDGTSKDVTLLEACQVLAIPLRDEYIKTHPNLQA